MPPVLILTFYCALAFFAAVAGGILPTLFKLTHTRLQVAVSFVAGLMLGLALLGMLPHASDELHSSNRGAAWMLSGFLIMFLLQRFLPFHHHDVVEGSPPEPCGHTHALAERSARKLNWAGVALGLSIHSIFDGLAIATAITSAERGHGGALGLGAAIAVILHKPFGAMAITTLMSAGGVLRYRLLVNLAFALVTPLGALLFYFGAGSFAQTRPEWIGATLAFCGGTFLCIAGSDLLPELQFHRHDRIKLSLALLIGISTAWLITHHGHGSHDHIHAHLHSSSGRSPK